MTALKKALLVYPWADKTVNIGDYIQSLAARQYFGDKVDIFLDRDRLDEYSGPRAGLIMNGWFMHDAAHWPPSADIDPLFVSFHINSAVYDRMLSAESIAYLNAHGPIGCRDENTVDLLRSHGVNAYFSGCLTLTLGKTYSHNGTREGIVFVDPLRRIDRRIRAVNAFSLLCRPCASVRLARQLFGRVSAYTVCYATAFFNIYRQLFPDELLKKSRVIKHSFQYADAGSEQDKLDKAAELLRLYARSELVVASRIHAALPCLSLETPVLYIDNTEHDDVSRCRLAGLLELFNVVNFTRGRLTPLFEVEGGKISSATVITNKTDYKVLRDALIAKCTEFAER